MAIEAWLKELGLERYADAFAANDVTEDLLPSLTADDLRDIGVASVGHRRRILEAIAAPPARREIEQTPERRQLTVMFCDLVGSTPLSARLDPEDLSAVIQAYQQRVNQTVARYGGFIARYLGDGVLVYFGWPQAREDDAERAVRAALDVAGAIAETSILGEQLHVRIGIATGLVVIGERIGAADSLQHTAIGETPNRAARLEAAASPDGVVIDAATRQQIGRLFDLRELGALNLRGLADPAPAWSVVGASGVLSRFEALHGGSLSPLIGREEELALLLRRWQRARAGNGNVVLISGEPGIGKSRLLVALDEALQGQPHIRLRYFCAPHRRDTPLAPFIGQFEHAAGFARGDSVAEKNAKFNGVLVPNTSPEDRTLLADLLSVPPEAGATARNLSAQRRKEWTLQALIRQFAALAQLQPVLVLAEDVHWSDPSSRELLDHLIEIIARLPVLLVLTYRPEFHAPWVGHSGVTLLTLGRLLPGEAAALAVRLAASAIPAALIERLVARSDGVPLFVEELTRAVLEAGVRPGSALDMAVPDSLQASLLSRLDRLPAAKTVAQIGSVAGRAFSHELIAAIADVPERLREDGLAQLVAAGLLFRRGEPPNAAYQFKHALVQDAAYQSMLRPRRAGLHTAIVAFLLEHDTGLPADPALLAHHCAEAGMIAEAMHYYLTVAEQSASRGAMEEAHAHLGLGLQRARDNPDLPDVAVWLTRYHLAIGEVLGAMRFYVSPESGAALDEAVRLARTLDEAHPARDGLMARALFGHFVHLLYRGEFPRVRALSEDLLALGQARNNQAIATLGAIANGICRIYQGEFAAARAVFVDTIALWETIGSPPVAEALGLDPASVLLVTRSRADALLGYVDTALTAARTAVEMARAAGHARSYVIVLGTAWDTFMLVGAEDDLRRTTTEFDALAIERGFQFYLARARYCSGWLMARAGEAAAGRVLIEDALAELEAAGAVLDGPQVHGMLADARAADGDPAGALAAIDRGLEIAAASGGVWWEAELHLRRAALFADDPEQAEAAFRRAHDVAAGRSARAQELRAAAGLAALVLQRGERQEARAILAPVHAWFTEGLDRPDYRAASALLSRIDAAG